MQEFLDKIILADCMDILRQLPDESVDLVLTDPPYNASNAAIACADKHYKTVNEDWDKGFIAIPFLEECKRVLKKNGSLITFCSFHTLEQYLNYNGMKIQQIIHWLKSNPFPAIAKVYTPNVEYGVWYVKGSPYVFNKKLAGQNVITTAICAGKEREAHPTQKPLELWCKLLNVHSNPGDIVLDPFSGSGTTAVACHNLGRHFICVEKFPKYHTDSVKRLEQAKRNQFLF